MRGPERVKIIEMTKPECTCVYTMMGDAEIRLKFPDVQTHNLVTVRGGYPYMDGSSVRRLANDILALIGAPNVEIVDEPMVLPSNQAIDYMTLLQAHEVLNRDDENEAAAESLAAHMDRVWQKLTVAEVEQVEKWKELWGPK